jgi:tetratricopeptide (TPR) repeat protein
MRRGKSGKPKAECGGKLKVNLMSIVALSSSRRLAQCDNFSVWLSGTILVCLTNFSAAQEGLPPVRQLIAETLALCNADRESHSLALDYFAEAQCYLGDFAAARKTLPPYAPDNFFRAAYYQSCAQIEIEMTGSTASIPAALWKDDFGFMHGDAALAFVERGEIDKALHHIDAIPRSVHSAFNVQGAKLVQNLKDSKQNDACRKVLLRWASCYEKADSVFNYRDSNRIPQLVAWLVEFQERPAATSLCEHFHTVLQAETDIDECGEFIGRAWAEYGLALTAVGDKDGASRALSQAHLWIDKARAVKFEPEKRADYVDFARSYAAIAARKAVILGTEEALGAYEQAYDFARQTLATEFGEFAFERIVHEQLTAGDTQGARETIKRMLTPRYTAKCWKSICEHELAHGKADAARAAARAAVQALDRDGFEPLMAQEMAPVAAAAALAGEKEVAQQLFQRALALSEANETPKFNHPWIAGIQVHAGLLSDTYRTIQSVEEPSDRIGPMAELCRAVAKAEYVARKAARQEKR